MDLGKTDALEAKGERVFTGKELFLRFHALLIDKLGETIEQKHLERSILVQIVIYYFDVNAPKENLIYYIDMERGINCQKKTFGTNLTGSGVCTLVPKYTVKGGGLNTIYHNQIIIYNYQQKV